MGAFGRCGQEVDDRRGEVDEYAKPSSRLRRTIKRPRSAARCSGCDQAFVTGLLPADERLAMQEMWGHMPVPGRPGKMWRPRVVWVQCQPIRLQRGERWNPLTR